MIKSLTQGMCYKPKRKYHKSLLIFKLYNTDKWIFIKGICKNQELYTDISYFVIFLQPSYILQ